MSLSGIIVVTDKMAHDYNGTTTDQTVLPRTNTVLPETKIVFGPVVVPLESVWVLGSPVEVRVQVRVGPGQFRVGPG